MNRVEKAALQSQAVSVLWMLKETRTYDELAELTGLPAGDLSRYINGHALPGVERAHEVVKDVGRDALADELEARVRFDDEGYVDDPGVVFDQSFLDLVAPVTANALDLERPDVILTAATDDITLGAATTSYFGARLAYAKKSKETAVEGFIESHQHLASGIELTYYLPASAIDDGECVPVVDDLIRSGETRELFLDIALQADADIVDVFALIAVGDEGTNHVRELTDAPVDALSGFDWRLGDPPKNCSELLSSITGDVEVDTYVPLSHAEWAA